MAKKILLADDSITIQKVVELTFSDGDYEVIAVNNGAKAIQKLSEMRPDIILSDIIMPEKNGYEVCEFVKSRPEFRSIPVVLLTGTFEPFDPDRADKAGCDAVVTKPFESQSLIHKVEELIQQSQAAAPPAAAPQPEASPWSEEKPAFTAPPPPSFTPAPAFPSAPAFTPAPAAPPFQTHDTDVFSAAPASQPASPAEMPFETPAAESFSGETRTFPRMSFDDLQRSAEPPAAATPPPPPPPAAPEPSPWDEPPAAQSAPAAAQAAAEPSPWDEPPAAAGETRTFPAMSFDDLQRAAAKAPEPAPAHGTPAIPEPPLWDEPRSAIAGETRAFPRMSFDDLQQPAAEPPAATPPQPAAPAEPSPWDEPPAFGGETRALPRMTFEDLQQMAPPAPPAKTPRADSSLWDEPAASAPPSWAPPEPAATPEPESFAAPTPSPFAEPQEEESSLFGGATAPKETAPSWSPKAESEPAVPDAAPPSSAGMPSDLSEEQIDRIARRVVQLISHEVVKNIAWEVIPDMAEMVVKERIRQLETES